MARHKASVWLNTHWESLRDFNRQWVAVSADGYVAVGERMEDVIAEVDERDLDRSGVVFTYLCFDTLA